jgi:hypothetical protein
MSVGVLANVGRREEGCADRRLQLTQSERVWVTHATQPAGFASSTGEALVIRHIVNTVCHCLTGSNSPLHHAYLDI